MRRNELTPTSCLSASSTMSHSRSHSARSNESNDVLRNIFLRGEVHKWNFVIFVSLSTLSTIPSSNLGNTALRYASHAFAGLSSETVNPPFLRREAISASTNGPAGSRKGLGRAAGGGN